MKIMIVNSKIKHKSIYNFVSDQSLVLDFIIYFVTTYYMRNYPIHIT